MMSLDEAKLDLTNYMTKQFSLAAVSEQEQGGEEIGGGVVVGGGWKMEDVSKVVKEMRQRVWEATKLTCSAGIGPSFMIAKVGT
jgi:nucleotidyltransferase/DNA polymerase involved in DNA repair